MYVRVHPKTMQSNRLVGVDARHKIYFRQLTCHSPPGSLVFLSSHRYFAMSMKTQEKQGDLFVI